MGNIANYRCSIKKVLSNLAEREDRLSNTGIQYPSDDKENSVTIFDEHQDHYLLFRARWGRYKCLQNVRVFIRLRNGKIWIEEDWTEDGVATDLLEMGVPQKDIVLGFIPAQIRSASEFAMA